MDSYEQFTKLYPIQKTIRFELKPQGRTKEHFDNSNFLEKDRERDDNYKILKEVIDDYHREFIDECLSNIQLNWDDLKKFSEEYRRSKEKKNNRDSESEQKRMSTTSETRAINKKNLEAEQKRMRGEIVSAFKKDDRFKHLFSEKLFSILLKNQIYEKGTLEEIEAFDCFNKFSGYFKSFHENRKNMYSDEDKETAISYRIINENFPKLLDNFEKYQYVCREYPEQIREAESTLAEAGCYIKMDEIFSIDNFNNVMMQGGKESGISRYNLAIGGIVQGTGEKPKGLNEFLNLAYQNEPNGRKKIRMEPLYKQILSKEESFSYRLEAFTDDSQLLSAIRSFFDIVEKDKNGNIFDRAVNLMSSFSNYDTSKIYIRKAYLNQVSKEIFGYRGKSDSKPAKTADESLNKSGGWEKLGQMLRDYKADSIGDRNLEKTCKKVDKWLDSDEFTLSDILGAISLAGSNETFEAYVSEICVARRNIDKEKEKEKNINVEKISGDTESIQIIKALLDSVQEFFHLLSPFQLHPNTPHDWTFYAEFNDIYDKLSAITPLYNQARNHLTKKNLDTSKIKLNFNNPTLANGWDVNKEYENTAVILIRDGKYYLGIMNPKNKRKIKFDEGSGAGPFYQKMVYKLLPGPYRMLPKVFFAKKNIDYYNPSQEIREGYKAGKHKKGKEFDKGFCHKLIDFFKESIQKNENWKVFDFKFSPTESYDDISEFYQEVEKQGYRMYFVNIPSDTIDRYVEGGDMFLFQIYNKDFAKGAKGNKDMHTLYWNAVFSEENLQKGVMKLSGEAELFYRKKSDIKDPPHREGEILVNRTYIDRTHVSGVMGEQNTVKESRIPVPDEIHKNLFDYYNHGRELTKEEKEYCDKVGSFKAYYGIVKDRRYLENKMYFHVPLTLNFKAIGEKRINKMAIEKFLTDENACIIGIDRGERNLLYYSIIDRNGKIIDQKSLNVIDGFDYHEKLSQRQTEREVARQSWNSIGKIKDLKEGYLAKAVHEISKMAIKYNAIVVLEDLHFGFKKGRLKVEKQIYQKFEEMLINKLNYLVFKDVSDSSDAGGVLNAYQLTAPLESFSKLGKQSGILFYVPAAFTSVIDPTTGFVDLFNSSSITSTQKKKEFLQRFESIVYSARDGGIFAFTFDYRNFSKIATDHRNMWTVYTHGERIRYVRDEKCYKTTDPTKRIKEALSGIEYDDGSDIRDKITQSGDNNLINTVYHSFMDTIKMRNKDGRIDYIISPVKNRNGEFFRSDYKHRDFPVDADANGAYHIALKGELLMRMIGKTYDSNSDKMPKLEHKDWFEFMQTRGDQ
ncbi:MAG: type V CRISPR-associated protein Cas12a/Cpf1 [Methanomassiliicoccaceae archaeon]|nr:type V CRISPR-associated protein Cas12a/Cpf1 [Methanomassiliicoccaceae archaeon]